MVVKEAARVVAVTVVGTAAAVRVEVKEAARVVAVTVIVTAAAVRVEEEAVATDGGGTGTRTRDTHKRTRWNTSCHRRRPTSHSP